MTASGSQKRKGHLYFVSFCFWRANELLWYLVKTSFWREKPLNKAFTLKYFSAREGWHGRDKAVLKRERKRCYTIPESALSGFYGCQL